MNRLHLHKELKEERQTQTIQCSHVVIHLLNLRADFLDVEALVVVRSQEEENSPELQEEVAVSGTLDHLVLEIDNLRG